MEKATHVFALSSLQAVDAGSLRYSHNQASNVVLQDPQHVLTSPHFLLIRRSFNGSVGYSASSTVTKSG